MKFEIPQIQISVVITVQPLTLWDELKIFFQRCFCSVPDLLEKDFQSCISESEEKKLFFYGSLADLNMVFIGFSIKVLVSSSKFFGYNLFF